MSGNRERRTYRVRQLPPHVDRHQAVALLARIGHDLGPSANIQILSLSSSLNPWENTPTKTATVCFLRLPAAFDNEQNEWVLPAQSELTLERDIIVDVHFLDFTVLNSPETHLLDCIAISGLASHPFGSWKQKSQGDTEIMWLRDQLPKDLPGIRSIIYGYDTTLLMSESFQTIDDIALSLIVKLRSIGRSSPSAKPLIFLAHSLGGIVLKRALVLLANSGDPVKNILDPLGRRATYIHLRDEGHKDNAVVALWKWERTGPKKILVKPESAIQRGSQPGDIFPVDKNHSEMVKFAQDDTNYRGVLSYLHDLCESPDRPKPNETQAQISISIGMSIFNKLFRKKQTNLPEDTLKKAKAYQPNRMFNLATATDDVIVKEEPNETTAKSMMDSLRHESAEWRFQEIEEGYKTTFDWVFENPDLKFCAWLRNGSGIYWINGKPGSGKSTLMKYVYHHSRTVEIMGQRDQSRLQVTANFFFHDRGISIQNSFEGLLHSVLYQILSQAPDVQKAVMPIYQERRPPPGKLWPVSDLELAFARILQQDQCLVQITLFLDALDEYSGSKEMMLGFIKSVIETPSTAATRIQLCFSSRPWAFLNDNLKGYAGFEIHKYTESDIWNYVGGRFTKISAVLQHSTATQSEHQSMNAVKLEITERAQGVFLWVKLITDHLITASAENPTAEELMKMVSILPSDLQELYERMVQRIPNSRRKEAFIMLEVVLRSSGRLDLCDFATTVACASHTTFGGCLKEVAAASSSPDSLSKINHRLEDRYGAFIEVVGFPDNPTVQFIHQTVKEFVSRPGYPQYILGTSRPIVPHNGHTFLSRFFISSLVSYISGSIIVNWLQQRLWEGFADHAYDAETSTGVCQQSFLDSMDPGALNSVSQALHKFYQLENINSVMAMAVVTNLRLYVKEKTLQGFDVNTNPEIPLLHCAVRAAMNLSEDRISNIPKRLESQKSERMTELLLDNGADMAVVFRGKSAFEELFDYFGSFSHMEQRSQLHIFKIVKAFLRNGHSPDSTIVFEPDMYFQTAYSCSPLHTAPIDLIHLLLRYRADVNVLDMNGRTPLDVAIGSLDTDLIYLESSDRVMLLLEKGGRITSQAKESSLERLRILLPLMKKPPLLSEIQLPPSSDAGHVGEPSRRVAKLPRSIFS